MTKNYLIAALYRALEMLAWCIGMSVVICALCVSGPMPVGSLQRDIALIVAPVGFIVWNIVTLRVCYEGRHARDSYYIINLCAYAIFALVSAGVYFFFHTDVYTWLFVITRFARYSNLDISSPVAIGLFHIILILSIFLAPSGMEWVREKEEKRQREMANIPPVMEITPEVTPVWLGTEDKSNEGNETKEENSLS